MYKKKHSIKTVKYDDVLFFCIYEHATEQVLDYFFTEYDAIKMKKKLDSGSGFDGLTPEFMLKIVKTKTDINTSFGEL